MCADIVKASPRLLILPLNSWSRKSLLCIALKAWYESHTYQPTPTKNTIVRTTAAVRSFIGKPFCIRLSPSLTGTGLRLSPAPQRVSRHRAGFCIPCRPVTCPGRATGSPLLDRKILADDLCLAQRGNRAFIADLALVDDVAPGSHVKGKTQI